MHTDPVETPIIPIEAPGVTPGDVEHDEPTPPLPADPPAPQRNPAVDSAVAPSEASLGARMATNPNVPPPEPLAPLNTPPNPGEVQPTPEPV